MTEVYDKVTVTAHYDDAGVCRCIYVYLNTDVVTVEDVAAAVRSVFRPESNAAGTWLAPTRSNETVEQPSVRISTGDPQQPPRWF